MFNDLKIIFRVEYFLDSNLLELDKLFSLFESKTVKFARKKAKDHYFLHIFKNFSRYLFIFLSTEH